MSLQHLLFSCGGSSGLHYLAAAARSVFDSHSRPEQLRLYILFEKLTPDDITKLKRSWEPWTSQVSFCRMSDYIGELAQTEDYSYWFRVWAYKVVPEEVEKLIYLDYDVVVLDDLSSLWQVELGDRLGAAVEDPMSRIHAESLSQRAKALGLEFDSTNRYFNSGVMLLNLRLWRELDVGNVLESKFRDHRPHEQFHDQAELNMLFSQEFLTLSPSWNVIEVPTYDLTKSSQLEPEQLDPKLLHFAGIEKVTGRWRRFSEKEAFYSALDRTEWTGWRSANDRTLTGKVFSQILEYKYLLHNGDRLKDHKLRLKDLLRRNPLLPLIGLLIPLNRLRRGILYSVLARKLRASFRYLRRRAYMELCSRCRPVLQLYYRLFATKTDSNFERAISAYSRSVDRFVFLQVGANDGFSGDAIHKFIVRDGWSGVLVEPQPEVFERELSRTYRGLDELDLILGAVDRSDGERELYRLSCCSARWAHGLSTFRRATLEKLIDSGYVRQRGISDGLRLPENLHGCIVAESVPTVTFETLLKRHSIQRLDLLQLDSEGYDAELLKMFPFHLLLPRFVRFESQHLSTAELRELKARMKELGYSWKTEGFDTFCELSERN